MASLMHSIGQLQHLTWLSVSDVGSSDDLHASGLAEALIILQQYDRLRHVHISQNWFSVSEAERVAEAVCGFTGLRSLNIAEKNFLRAALGVLVQGTNLSSLRSLHLRGSWRRHGEGSQFLAHTSNTSHLQSLELGNNRLEYEKLPHFIDCIPNLS